MRSQLAYHHAHIYGPFDYVQSPKALPGCSPAEHEAFVKRVRDETERSKETFIVHFQTKYGTNHAFPPIWMAAEVMSFGTVLSFYRSASSQVKQAVASTFGMPHKVFSSWLLSLNAARNICAHHSRMWNRELGVKPFIPFIQTYPDWHTPVKIENKRLFAILTICRYCLGKVAPQSGWPRRLDALLAQYPNIPQFAMGIPPNWKSCPIWQEGRTP